MTTWYAIADHITGALVSTGTVIGDDVTLANQGLDKIELGGDPTGQVWDATNRLFTVAPAVPASPISKLAFIERFTPQEWAALDNSSDPMLKLFLYKLSQATTVDPSGWRVQQGLAYLVGIGMITQNRATTLGQP